MTDDFDLIRATLVAHRVAAALRHTWGRLSPAQVVDLIQDSATAGKAAAAIEEHILSGAVDSYGAPIEAGPCGWGICAPEPAGDDIVDCLPDDPVCRRLACIEYAYTVRMDGSFCEPEGPVYQHKTGDDRSLYHSYPDGYFHSVRRPGGIEAIRVWHGAASPVVVAFNPAETRLRHLDVARVKPHMAWSLKAATDAGYSPANNDPDVLPGVTVYPVAIARLRANEAQDARDAIFKVRSCADELGLDTNCTLAELDESLARVTPIRRIT